MKTIILTTSILIFSTSLSAQKVPVTENYLLNKYALSSAYAGVYNSGYLFASYRQDLIGIDGGPQTLVLSYSTSPSERIGIGSKIVSDKTDLFKQTQIMGTSSYQLQLARDRYVYVGISLGVYKSSVDMYEFLFDPKYISDPTVLSWNQNPKTRFIGDYSLIYSHNGIETGIAFSNIVLGNVEFQDVNLSNNPFANYQAHTTFKYEIDYDWVIEPLLIFRGGKNISSQLEVAAMITYKNRIWGSIMFRTQKVLGMGFGLRTSNGILLNYVHNLNMGIATFQNNEIIIGFDLNSIIKKALPCQTFR